MRKSPTLKELMALPEGLSPITYELSELGVEYQAIFGVQPNNDVRVIRLDDEEYLRRMKRVMEMRDESLWYEGLPELPPDAVI